MILYTHIQSMFNNYRGHSLYRIVVTVISVMDVMNMGNIAPRAAIKPTSLAIAVPVC